MSGNKVAAVKAITPVQRNSCLSPKDETTMPESVWVKESINQLQPQITQMRIRVYLRPITHLLQTLSHQSQYRHPLAGD